MSLRPLSSEIQFLLGNSDDPSSMRWDLLREVLSRAEEILLYGFSWILWLAWSENVIPEDVAAQLKHKRVCFIHSGGWKKLENIRVSRDTFDRTLLKWVAPTSKVVDFYGLVEQLGIVYPLCECGTRHVPVWADVIVRDTHTLKPLTENIGQLQLLNALAHGAPYHSVLTEDVGRLVAGRCPHGRSGKRFELVGRLPKAELRGCANV
jgi:hypothetical protein